MPRPRKSVPTYRLHKQSGQAVVTVNVNDVRKDVLLGRYDSPESHEEYRRVLAQLQTPAGAELLAAGGTAAPADVTVNEVLLAYRKWAEAHATTADGKPSTGGTSPRYALRKVREMFGTIPAAEFGPKAFKAVREAWVKDGLSRKVINGRAGAVRRAFKWAVSEELAGPAVYQRLQAVEGLGPAAPTPPTASRSGPQCGRTS